MMVKCFSVDRDYALSFKSANVHWFPVQGSSFFHIPAVIKC